jgi:hypothetical protein
VHKNVSILLNTSWTPHHLKSDLLGLVINKYAPILKISNTTEEDEGDELVTCRDLGAFLALALEVKCTACAYVCFWF